MDDELLLYPCAFPVKAMGRTADDFDALVMSIVRHHCADIGEGAVQVKQSQHGAYQSVTVTIQAHSRAQLDALYAELTAHERVLMVL